MRARLPEALVPSRPCRLWVATAGFAIQEEWLPGPAPLVIRVVSRVRRNVDLTAVWLVRPARVE
jgi:hypothetical protein